MSEPYRSAAVFPSTGNQVLLAPGQGKKVHRIALLVANNTGNVQTVFAQLIAADVGNVLALFKVDLAAGGYSQFSELLDHHLMPGDQLVVGVTSTISSGAVGFWGSYVQSRH